MSRETVYAITLGSRTIEYHLTRKSVKRINLRIGGDGVVRVSASPRVPRSEIEAFMREKADAILRAIDRAAQRSENASPPLRLCDGAELLFFGEPLTLRISAGARAVQRKQNVLHISLPDPTDSAALRRAVSAWQAEALSPVIDRLLAVHFPAFSALGIASPCIGYRRMVSRWGSCRADTGKITLNTALAGAPLPCVEYVLLHELVHLLVPDHSARFYAQLSAFLPDWAEQKEPLRRLGNRLIERENL